MKKNKRLPGQALVTRRGFLITGATAAAGIAAPSWAAKGDPVIEFARENCGAETARPRILVGYASCCGTTGGIAQAIGQRLCSAGARVDVQLMKEVKDPSVYDGMVLGSAIHAGQWLSEGLRFIDKHQKLLASRKVAYFIACLALSEDSTKNRHIADNYLRPVLAKAPAVKPVALEAFAGAVFYNKMPRRYVPIMKRIAPNDGDYRNWGAIRAWADELAKAMITKD